MNNHTHSANRWLKHLRSFSEHFARWMAGVLWICLAALAGIMPAHAADGVDGARTVTAANTQVNRYAQVTDLTTNTITVSNIGTLAESYGGGSSSDYTNDALSTGDLVLVYQAQGASFTDTSNAATYGAFSYDNAGHYEFAEVYSVSGNTITLCSNLTNTYTSVRIFNNQPVYLVQVVRVPQYTLLTVNSGASVVAPAWDGNVGGIVALKVQGAVTVSGNIDVSGRGFRGGERSGDGGDVGSDYTGYVATATTPYCNGGSSGNAGNQCGAGKGESILGFTPEYNFFGGGAYARGAPANGGGGGNIHNASGGGGANGNNGGTWNGAGFPDPTTSYQPAWALDNNFPNYPTTSPNGAGGGRGGYTYAANNQNALTRAPGANQWGGDRRRQVGGLGGRPLTNNPASSLFFGGGGGGGHNNSAGNTATNGAAGGGLILIDAGSLSGTGTISANGAAVTTNARNDGSGGGGGGGTIAIRTTTQPTGVSLSAAGGQGGSQVFPNNTTDESEGPGGGGGGGYIQVSGGVASGTPNVGGGANGTSNSRGVTEFPPNGATRGYAGQYVTTAFTFPAAGRCGLDFGDAPDPSFPTLIANNGPRHLFPATALPPATALRVSIGSLIDAEANGLPNATATGDDTNNQDDEDGVSFSTPAGGGPNIIAQVSVTNAAGLNAQVCGWLDVNVINGFETSERQCRNVTTTTAVNFEWLVSSTTTQTYNARFRVCVPTGGIQCDTPTGFAINGEVEDYQITYNPTLATVGSFDVKPKSVDSVLSALAGQNGDPAALLALLAGWDPELAKRLEGADAETLAAALRHYLDPDGDGQVAVVRWDTLQEHGTVGFFAERAEGDGWTRLNGGLLPGLIDAPQGGEYWLLDPDVTAGAHRYRLVELEAWGSERLHGPWELQIGAASSRAPARTAVQSTNTEEDTELWSEWRGLAQGFAARKRVPPPPPAQPLSARAVPQAATVTTPTGALWLRTQGEGLYRIPTAQLATLLGDKEDQVRKWLSKEKKLALVNAGVPIPWYYDEASDALFFVAREYRTLHTDHNAYRLAKDNARSLTMAERTGAGPAPGSPNGTFRDTARLEQEPIDRYSLWSVTDDTEADYWFWDYLYAGTNHDAVTVPLTLPGAATSGQGQLRVHLRGWTDFEQGNDHRVSATLNGTTLGAPLEWDGFTTAVLAVPFDQALLANGNSLKLLSEKINAAATKNPGQWLDRIEADYWREPKAENGQLWLHGLAAGTHTVAGFDSNTIQVIEAPATTKAVWRHDVTIAPAGSGWQVSFNAPQGGDFLVVDGTALQAPTAEIDAPSTLAKANNRADYLIVAPRALAQTANALAAYRAGNKRKVEIAWLDDIYDEFSFGRTDPRAISDFLTYVHRNWKRVPEYVVLLGNGTLDHKNRQGYGDSLLPVRMMMSPWGLLVSDHRYTDINGDGRSEYAFGRIPATTDAQGVAYVQKIQSATSAPRRAVVVADNPDGGGDFHANADRQAKELQGLFGPDSVTKLYHPTDAVRSALTNSATWNVAYLSYDGHGSAKQLGKSDEKFLTLNDAAALSNQTLPVFVALTCEAGNSAVPGWGGSVTGGLTLNPTGGALAALAPTGVSLDNEAQVIGSAFADYLIGGRLSVGQAAREAQFQSAGQVAPFMLGVYQILGDPAAQLP